MASNPRRCRPDSRALSLETDLLKKGATFSSPLSPPMSPDLPFRPPSLPRHSQTCLDDVIDSHRRRVALTLSNIDKTLAAGSAAKLLRDDGIPVPRGLLTQTLDSLWVKEPETERRALRPRTRRTLRNHESDSGLGSSLATTKPTEASAKKTTAKAVTRSAAARATNLPRISPKATNRIFEHTLKPLLAKPSFKDFHPLLLDCPAKIQDKEIVCLRDLEKTLILLAPEKTKAADLYLDFCLATVRCIQATVEYLSEHEQTRPRDLPYTSGYFIDLVDQIRRYAEQLADAKDKGEEGDMAVDPTDEIKLHGGIHVNGRPAELVRIKKNGKTISMATGQPIDSVEEEADGGVAFKRSASQELEHEEEIMRSMARRKKNASPEELAPKKCREPGCNKEFKRPCDLTKHEKTHSRPWKCPVPTCKYHEYGWPTEKEMDRHHNDKHSSAPPMYECLFKPCPYKSKRESNCKQHMEKAHNWTYVRTKSNGKKLGMSDGAGSAEPTPQLYNMPTPTSDFSMGVATPPSDMGGFYHNNIDFPAYLPPNAHHYNIPQELDLDYSPGDHSTPGTELSMGRNSISSLARSSVSMDRSSVSMDRNSAFQDMGNDYVLQDDIYGARVQVPHIVPNMNMYKQEVHFAHYPAEVCPQTHNVHISPHAPPNAMLFTPTSLADESFDEQQEYNGGGGGGNNSNSNGGDFVLFPAGGSNAGGAGPVAKRASFEQPLFVGEVANINTAPSQPPAQDYMSAINNLDWSGTYNFAAGYHH